MMLATLNHENARQIFPTGGIDPWPNIEDYSSNGRPFAAPKQGLSWAFQLLPYLEENSVHDIDTAVELSQTPVLMYFCPTRRGPTQNPNNQRWLIDYCSVNPAPARSQVGGNDGQTKYSRVNSDADYDKFINPAINSPQSCTTNFIWGGATTGHLDANARPGSRDSPTRYRDFYGVIVRSSYFVIDGTGASGNPDVLNMGTSAPVKVARISDGTSKTMVITEKRLDPTIHAGGTTADDAGWSDGWDYDVIRTTGCVPTPDSGTPQQATGSGVSTIGAAHTGVFIAGFADGSVHGLNYDIDLETFNRLGHRSDGEVVDLEL